MIALKLHNILLFLSRPLSMSQYYVYIGSHMSERSEQSLVHRLGANLAREWSEENTSAMVQENIVEEEIVWSSSKPGGRERGEQKT